MVFSSTVFLFCFLPAAVLLHTVIPARFTTARNTVLVVCSLLFYAYGEPVTVFLLFASVLFGFLLAPALAPGRRGQRVLLGVGIALSLSLLCFFKYIPWLTALCNEALGASLPVPAVTLPIGISFYTFQLLSYLIDVYRGDEQPQRRFSSLLLYISFFPQLIAGPIVRYGEIRAQLGERTLSPRAAAGGLRRFTAGLAKKVLLADTAAVLADAAFGAGAPSAALCWGGAVAYCLQIYFDFSGYSDMALGLGALFGFRLPENFRYPYAAPSVRAFWQRWHITLTGWFRTYVYIPLGGNRRGRLRTVLNRYLVFFLTGLWHGANLTFIIWGLYHGTLMLAEELLHLDRLSARRAARPLLHLYTAFAVLCGFVLFRSASVSAALAFFGRMFAPGSNGGAQDLFLLLDPVTVLYLAAAVLLCFPVRDLFCRLASRVRAAFAAEVATTVVTLPLFVLCVMHLGQSAFHPFLYYVF